MKRHFLVINTAVLVSFVMPMAVVAQGQNDSGDQSVSQSVPDRQASSENASDKPADNASSRPSADIKASAGKPDKASANIESIDATPVGPFGPNGGLFSGKANSPAQEARRQAFLQQMSVRFDTNHDGKLDNNERARMNAFLQQCKPLKGRGQQ